MLQGLRHILQAQDDGGEGSAGEGGAQERKRFVESQVEERFQPRQVREVLAKYGDKAEIALERVIDEDNDKIRRFMRRQAELEYDLERERENAKRLEGQVKTVEKERDEKAKELDAHLANVRAEAAEAALLKKVGGDEVLATRHKAYLKLDGYDMEVEGEGEKARIMLVKDGQRHHFDTVVNDRFYARYADAKPVGDDPLGGGYDSGNGASTGSGKGGGNLAQEVAKLAKARAEQQRLATQIPE